MLINDSKSGGNPETLFDLKIRAYKSLIHHPDPNPELVVTPRDSRERKTDPNPERRNPDGVIVVHPGGMQVKAISKTPVNIPEGGGVVGRKVTGRSQKARNRLMKHLIAVNLEDVTAQRKAAKYSRCLFITLTYPDIFQDHEKGKEQIKAFRKRLEYHYGLKWAVWVQEWQKRGALHYHLVVLLPKVVKVQDFRKWLSQAWYDVVGSDNPKHLRAGTSADAVYIEQGNPGHLLGYLSKELGGYGGKSYQNIAFNEFGEVLETGKTWGIWGREAFNAMKVIVCRLRIAGREAWMKFKENVSNTFSPSKYLRKVADMAWWGGGLLFGASETLLDELMDGIPKGAWSFA